MKVSNPNHLEVPNEFWINSKKLDLTEKLLFLYLATQCYGSKNVCWPSQERIANETGISLRTVKSKLKSMVQKEVIVIGRACDQDKRIVDTRQYSYTLKHWDDLMTSKEIKPISHQKKEKLDTTHKPKTINKSFPNEKKLKNEIYSWFSANSKEPYKFKKYLDNANNIDELIEAFKYINYWKDGYIGRGTLGDFVNNTKKFIDTASATAWSEKMQYYRDNRKIFLMNYISENELFDITNNSNRSRLQGIELTYTQKLYLDNCDRLFVFETDDGSKRLRTYMDTDSGGEFLDNIDELKAVVLGKKIIEAENEK